MALTQVYDADGTLLHSQDTDPDGNEAAIRQQAAQALADNRTFLALPSPTQAQSLAQIRSLTRQNQRIVRLLLNDLDGTD